MVLLQVINNNNTTQRSSFTMGCALAPFLAAVARELSPFLSCCLCRLCGLRIPCFLHHTSSAPPMAVSICKKQVGVIQFFEEQQQEVQEGVREGPGRIGPRASFAFAPSKVVPRAANFLLYPRAVVMRRLFALPLALLLPFV